MIFEDGNGDLLDASFGQICYEDDVCGGINDNDVIEKYMK